MLSYAIQKQKKYTLGEGVPALIDLIGYALHDTFARAAFTGECPGHSMLQ